MKSKYYQKITTTKTRQNPIQPQKEREKKKLCKTERLICLCDRHYCCYLGIISYSIFSRSNLVHSQRWAQRPNWIRIPSICAQSLKDIFSIFFFAFSCQHTQFGCIGTLLPSRLRAVRFNCFCCCCCCSCCGYLCIMLCFDVISIHKHYMRLFIYDSHAHNHRMKMWTACHTTV